MAFTDYALPHCKLFSFVVPGSTLEDSHQALDLATRYPNSVFATSGIHPYNAASTPVNDEAIVEKFRSLTADERCLAVGECGLDYSEGFPDKSFQIPWFTLQVERAIEINKPLYLHSRQCTSDFVGILKSYGFGEGITPPVPGVIHCFTGDQEELDIYLKLGFSIGLTGYVFKVPEEELTTWLKVITLDRLVIETDAPYMGFASCRETETSKKKSKYPNVPASLVQVASRIAGVGGWSIAEVASASTINALRFLRKVA